MAAVAQAKEIVSLKVCGASGCNTLTDRAQLQGWEPNNDPTSQSGAPAQRYYKVESAFDEGGTIIHREKAYWLPDIGLMRFQGHVTDSWWKGPDPVWDVPEGRRGDRRVHAALSKVTVRGRTAADPNSYLRLFGNLRYRAFPRARLHPISIKLTAETAQSRG